MSFQEQVQALSSFDQEHVGSSKGALSLVLILTRAAREKTFPLDPQDFVTAKGGQVSGLGGGAIKKILAEHKIFRILSNEGGRTSRGNMERMHTYVALLNQLAGWSILDLEAAEDFWAKRVQAYFDSMPFNLRLDPARSLRGCIRDLFSQALERQKQNTGTMYVGAMMQHLVGAKLEHISPGRVTHHGFSVADSPLGRSGDFIIGDVSIHVTTAPGESLINKCESNLQSGLKPMIVTTEDGVGGAKALAKHKGIDDRLDVIEIEQFLVTNIYEWSDFDNAKRRNTAQALIATYNRVIEECETDPSLRIEME